MILLLGGSGLVGREILAQLGDRQLPTRAPFRRQPQRPASASLQIVEDPNWSTTDSLVSLMSEVDTVLCAIGTTIAQAGSEAAFRAVDFEIVDRAAREARRAGVQHFGLVSAVGADAHSKIFYNRVKGEAEASVREQKFYHTIILRPSLLLGDRRNQALRPGEKFAQALSPALSWMMRGAWARYRPIEARCVARAMLNLMLKRSTSTPHEEARSVTILEGQKLFQVAAL